MPKDYDYAPRSIQNICLICMSSKSYLINGELLIIPCYGPFVLLPYIFWKEFLHKVAKRVSPSAEQLSKNCSIAEAVFFIHSALNLLQDQYHNFPDGGFFRLDLSARSRHRSPTSHCHKIYFSVFCLSTLSFIEQSLKSTIVASECCGLKSTIFVTVTKVNASLKSKFKSQKHCFTKKNKNIACSW